MCYLIGCTTSTPLDMLARPTRSAQRWGYPQPRTCFGATRSPCAVRGIDSTAPPVLEDIEGDYEVHKILDHDDRRDGRYYFIQWKLLIPLHHYRATWEPRNHLDGAKDIRDAYDAKYPLPEIKPAAKRKRQTGRRSNRSAPDQDVPPDTPSGTSRSTRTKGSRAGQ